MISGRPQHVELTEYEPIMLPPHALPAAVAEKLWREYEEKGAKLRVEFPSPKTGQQWRLTAQGWIGHIPLTPDFNLIIQPKVSLGNLFRMWEYAYDLRPFHLLDGLAQTESLAEFYEGLALILAQRILDRGRQGFHRAYLGRTGSLPYLRGQLKLSRLRPYPASAHLPCRYDEVTADIPDNQILTYTLSQIARSRRCREPVQSAIRRAYHVVAGVATPQPVSPLDCAGRTYSRLNQDYQPLHALCRFFLEHSGPTLAQGNHIMLPFLVNMAELYERFVARWLRAHLPSGWRLNIQENVRVGPQEELRFEIDLVLYDVTGPRFVLDTKYKVPGKPENADVSQIVTYARAKACPEAVLIYPTPLPRPLDVYLGDLRLRTLAFPLDHDLDTAGHHFLSNLLATAPE